MGDKVFRAQRVGRILDERQQRSGPPPHVALAHPHCHLLVEHRLHGHRVRLPGVDPAEGYRASAANHLNRAHERRGPVESRGLHQRLGES